jgi:hypothetical protein
MQKEKKVHLNLGRTYCYYIQIWKRTYYIHDSRCRKEGKKKNIYVEKRGKNTSTASIILDV